MRACHDVASWARKSFAKRSAQIRHACRRPRSGLPELRSDDAAHKNNSTLTQTTGIALLRVPLLPSWRDRGIRGVNSPPDLRDAYQDPASSYDRRHTKVW